MSARIPVETVHRLHAVIGGDAIMEEMIIFYIGNQYGARSLLELPPKVATAILQRPTDFIKAVKQHCLAELPF